MAKITSNTDSRVYETFAEAFPRCWACGWSPERSAWRDWMRPELHCAHILGGPNRTCDRRNLCRLCEGCHRLAHGAAINVDGRYLPKLWLANLLWLKKHRDPDWYDRKYLTELSRQGLPHPSKPHGWFVGQYQQQGMYWLPGKTYASPP